MTSTPPDRIAAIVVNYGTADLAMQAVESLLSHSHAGRVVDVHLVDNASPKGDAAVLRDAHAARGWGDAVTLWLEDENHGFGRGNNVALNALAAQDVPPEKVYLLNPDAKLTNEAVDILATALEGDATLGAVGSAVLRPDQSPTTAAFRFPSVASEFARISNFILVDRVFANRLVPLPADQPAGPVDWVTGASVMFRFEAIKDIGFFDPAFFLYYEEVDLMKRLSEQGWKIAYVPTACVVHEEGAATGQFGGSAGRQRDPSYLYDSWAIYFSNRFGRAGAACVAALLWPAAVLNIAHNGIRGRTTTLPRRFFRDHWQFVLRPLIFGR